jgi:hypothetical protein
VRQLFTQAERASTLSAVGSFLQTGNGELKYSEEGPPCSEGLLSTENHYHLLVPIRSLPATYHFPSRRTSVSSSKNK